MYKAIKQMVREKPQTIIVNDAEGTTCNEKRVTEEITKHFNNMFNTDTAKEFFARPQPMQQPFTAEEVKTAANRLKNNKSAGIDDITAEHLKHAPQEVYQEIADIFNNIAETGEFPVELNTGILIPLQKPGKPKGPPGNLRPIVLLTMLRKLLAICMIKRSGSKIDARIPRTQAAYRAGRSTTEQAFVLKILAEKAITAEDYQIIILLMDMSKAFDTVERENLLQLLSTILENDELHILKVLLTNIQLTVKYKKSLGTMFTTNTGVPQGDCLSPILFTLYLAKALSYEETQPTTQDHDYALKTRHISKPYENMLPEALKDHTYSNFSNGVCINQQYADDISWISTVEATISEVKNTVPEKLKTYNLHTNPTKDEEYTVKRNGPEDWKECKYLGSKLDTDTDIRNRKQKAMAAFNQYKSILLDKKLGLSIRLRVFNAYVKSIFLYNSELWTTNKKVNNTIDVFQRNLYRKMLQIRWPHRISNIELYKRVNTEEWSTTVKRRRLIWVGHLLRLHEETPAQQALAEATRRVKLPRGGQKSTWVRGVNRDLKEVGYSELGMGVHTSAQDRKTWRKTVMK